MDNLPTELLEIIFCHLDLEDILVFDITNFNWYHVFNIRFPFYNSTKNKDNYIRLLMLLYLNIKDLDIYSIDDDFIAKYKNILHIFDIDKLHTEDIIIIDSTSNMIEIPMNILNFDNLMILNLSNNYIKELPDSFIQLKHLRILGLSNNEFDTIPEILFFMNNLVDLDLSYNKIVKIPTSITSAISPRYLNLRGNRINKLPYKYYKLKDMYMIDQIILYDNPLKLKMYNIPLKMRNIIKI